MSDYQFKGWVYRRKGETFRAEEKYRYREALKRDTMVVGTLLDCRNTVFQPIGATIVDWIENLEYQCRDCEGTGILCDETCIRCEGNGWRKFVETPRWIEIEDEAQ